jgi:hypothetical protein
MGVVKRRQDARTLPPLTPQASFGRKVHLTLARFKTAQKPTVPPRIVGWIGQVSLGYIMARTDAASFYHDTQTS